MTESYPDPKQLDAIHTFQTIIMSIMCSRLFNTEEINMMCSIIKEEAANGQTPIDTEYLDKYISMFKNTIQEIKNKETS